MSSVKGYKAMNSDMTCRKFKFKVGKTYTSDSISMCTSGFHFCENIFDVYNYYPKSETTVICEVEALGKVEKEFDKSCTDKIKIVRKLSETELLKLWINKTNSGDWNSGDWNSGYGNSGNRNSGDWNSGDGNSGYFNTVIPVYFFNKPSNITYTKELENKIRNINVKPILEWVTTERMTEEEKTNNNSHKVTGGFLRSTGRHDFRNLTEDNKTFIKSLPNYDDEVFKVISNGVSLNDDVSVIVNGVTKTISKVDAQKLGLI